MKKIIKYMLFILFAFSLFTLSACKDEESNIESIKIKEDIIAEAVKDGKVTIDELTLSVTYKDGTEEDVQVTSDMITNGKLEDIVRPLNEYYIDFTYEGVKVSIKFVLPKVTVVNLEVNQDSVTEAYKNGYLCFDKLLLKANQSNGTVVDVDYNTYTISDDDLIALCTKGEHTVSFKYKNFELKYTFTLENDYYVSPSKLDEVKDDSVVAVKGYVSYANDTLIYLTDSEGGLYAQTNKNVSKNLKTTNEVVIIGTKAVKNSIAMIKDTTYAYKTGKNSESLAVELNDSTSISDKVYMIVNFNGAHIKTLPEVLNPIKDTVLEAVDSNNNTFKVVLPKTESDEVIQSKLNYISKIFDGHELVLDNLLVGYYKDEVVLLLTANSFICPVFLDNEYVAPEEGEVNSAFNDFLDEMYIANLGTSPFNINFLVYDVEALDAKYGTNLATAPVIATTDYDMSPEAEIEGYNTILDYKARLLAFDYDTLSHSQKIAYDVLLDQFNSTIKYFKFNDEDENVYFYYGTQLGSQLGYQAQLPSLLSEYRFDDKRDIDNYLEYLKTAQNDFEALFNFEKAKMVNNKGNQLADYVIDLIIDQCDNLIETDEECYLIAVFNERIEGYDFLTAEEVEEYKTKNASYINDYFLPAYDWLRTNLATLKDINDDETAGALCNTAYGRDYYQIKFQDACSTDMTILELRNYIKEKGKQYEELLKLYGGSEGAPAELNYMSLANLTTYTDGKLDYYASLNSIIPYLQAKIEESGDFPSLPRPYIVGENIALKEIPLALQENSSPAYYLISPWDADVNEVFYINPISFKDIDSYMFTTVAHECWPGHLYQNVYFKNTNSHDVRSVLSYTGYAEAWTTYIEGFIPKYVIDDYSQLQLALYEVYSSIQSCLLDIGINYEGWDVAQVINYYGITMDDIEAGRYVWSTGERIKYEDFEEIYYFYVELPTNYLTYYFNACQLLDIRTEFIEKMGIYYSDAIFNTIYLETGDAPWSVIKAEYDNYASLWGVNGTNR